MPTGFTTVSGTNLCDATGAKISNATIYFQPCNNSGVPLSFSPGGVGQAIYPAVSAQISGGAFSVSLADSILAHPTNIAYHVTIIDNVSHKQMLGPGYIIQPSGGTWNFDTFTPNLGTLATMVAGPVGPAGPATTVTSNGASGRFTVAATGVYGASYLAALAAIIDGGSAADIYSHLTGSFTNIDAVAGVVPVPGSSTEGQANGIAGYASTLSTITNTVGVFGMALCKVSGGKIWGGNFASIDSAATPAQPLYGIEVDTQPQGAASNYPTDLSVLGVYSVLYAAQAGSFGSNFVSVRDEVGQWLISFRSLNGAAQVGLLLGSQSATTHPTDSQYMQLDAVNSAGATISAILQLLATGNFQITPPSGGNIVVGAGNLNLASGAVNAPTVNANSSSATTAGVTAGLSVSTAVTNLFAFKGYVGGSTPWTAVFYSAPGASSVGLWLGATAGGNNQPSQQIRVDASDGSGNPLPFYLRVQGGSGDVVLTPSGNMVIAAGHNLVLTSGSVTAAGVSIPSGGITGIPTAPSGSCAGFEGSWVFSQDGHATWGNPATHLWVTKI